MAKDLVPHLVFENSKTAITYYEEVFGATEAGRMPVNKEMAPQFGLDPKATNLDDYTTHGAFKIFGQPVYFADPFGQLSEVSKGTSLMLAATTDDAAATAELEALFKKAEASGRVKVVMPFGDAFWGGKFGLLVDEYGIQWQFAVNPQI